MFWSEGRSPWYRCCPDRKDIAASGAWDVGACDGNYYFEPGFAEAVGAFLARAGAARVLEVGAGCGWNAAVWAPPATHAVTESKAGEQCTLEKNTVLVMKTLFQPVQVQVL